MQDKLQEYWGRQVPANFKSPPYVTAEPIVSTTTLRAEDMKDAFIVMGTDGLWEKLTNEQVVGLVGKYLDKANGKEARGWFGVGKDGGLNVTETQGMNTGSKKPNATDKRNGGTWVWQDRNAATLLIRNALGGGNLDEVPEPRPPTPPLSRSLCQVN
jgi:pyruvate dehydrogenase phosphatase